MDERPHVVIVGGGFAGLRAAREFEYASVRVTLVDRQNHHLFQPLLYQVATAALSPADIAAPIRKVLNKQENATVLLGTVNDVDLERQRVFLEDGHLDYDYLIVAAGMQNNYFGHDDWERAAPGMKTLDDAFEVRQRVLLAFEAAERESDPELRAQWLTFIVIGGGPTGVELAGALKEIATRTLCRDFRNFNPGDARVILLEGLDSVLPSFPSEHLRRRAGEQLEALGVEVRLSTMVSDIQDWGVEIKGGDTIQGRTVIWTAGVRTVEISQKLGAETDRAGRVKVMPDLTVPGHPNVYAVGDMAYVEQEDGQMVPGLAPAAIQMGRHAAMNIKRELHDDEHRPFRYRDKGVMATIGRSKAIAKTGRFEFSGFTAWMAWLFIHLLYLVGFRNRVAVLLEWFWSYSTFQRSARIIVREDDTKLLPPGENVDVMTFSGAEAHAE